MRNDRLFALLILAALAAPAHAQDGGQVTGPQASEVAPSRFGGREPDQAYGAYQRGLYITALKLALPRAEAGDKAAQTLVAEIYARGLGVRRDGAEAARWYEAAAEQGVPEAQFQTALMLIDGEFLPRDRTRAYEMMRAAADAGNPMAQFNFGQLMIDEAGNEADEREALAYFERAARTGLPDAQYALALMLIQGEEPDFDAARTWLARAAQQNFDTAQVELGSWLVEGIGGTRDMEAGFGWIELAATGGNVAARNRLAKLYWAGMGVEGDPIVAAAWYMLARREGLVDPVMEDHLAGLSEAQIDEAGSRMAELEQGGSRPAGLQEAGTAEAGSVEENDAQDQP